MASGVALVAACSASHPPAGDAGVDAPSALDALDVINADTLPDVALDIASDPREDAAPVDDVQLDAPSTDRACPAFDAGEGGVVVTVDTAGTMGTSLLATGIIHIQNEPVGTPSGPNAAAVTRARGWIRPTTTFQAAHLMAAGTLDPEPLPPATPTSAPVYDWSTLDARMELAAETGGTPVLTLWGAPTWMTQPGWSPVPPAVDAGTWPTDWSYQNAAPLPAHVADFAALAGAAARHYNVATPTLPVVRYYQVWSELKGFSSGTAWDAMAYTTLYNQVYHAIKAVNPANQVGGPYALIRGCPGHLTAVDLTAIDYWFQHAAGYDFIAVDSGAFQPTLCNRDAYIADPFSYVPKFDEMIAYVRSEAVRYGHPDTPIWLSEWYIDNFNAESHAPDAQNALETSALIHMVRAGLSVELRFAPQGTMPDGDGGVRPFEGDQESIWSDTNTPGGGQPYPFETSVMAIHQQFAPGTVLLPTTRSATDVEVLASPTTTIVVNQRATAMPVRVNGLVLAPPLAPYEVRVIHTPAACH